MGQSADQLREEIAAKREDAAQKIDAIQAQVEGTVQQVQETVQDTVEQVKQSFDVRHQIEQRPLLALGAALLAGFAFGSITGGGGDGQPPPASSSGPSQLPAYRPRHSGVSGLLQRAVKEAGLEDAVTNAASALLATVTDKVKATIGEAVPGVAAKVQHAPPRGNGGTTQRGGNTPATPATTDAAGRPVPTPVGGVS